MTEQAPTPEPSEEDRESQPCPFCGGFDVFVERADFSSCYVICNDCGARGPASCDEVDSDAEASESGQVEPGELPARRLWDTRALSPSADTRMGEGCQHHPAYNNVAEITYCEKCGEALDDLIEPAQLMMRDEIIAEFRRAYSNLLNDNAEVSEEIMARFRMVNEDSAALYRPTPEDTTRLAASSREGGDKPSTVAEVEEAIDGLNAIHARLLSEIAEAQQRSFPTTVWSEAQAWKDAGTILVATIELERARAALASPAPMPEKPTDMILHCPKCGLQHVDEATGEWQGEAWTNPPHRSHLCHGCGCIWRPADVATNGVAAIRTKGKNDTDLAAPMPETECRHSPNGRHQVDTSMESGPNHCFHCEQPMPVRSALGSEREG